MKCRMMGLHSGAVRLVHNRRFTMIISQEQYNALSPKGRKALVASGEPITIEAPTEAATMANPKSGDKLLSRVLEFISAVQKIETKSKGVHSVYSGLNTLLSEEFKLDKPALFERLDALVAAGKLQSHFARGGVMYYIPGQMPAKKPQDAASIRSKYGL
jgi:hypothetical protein